MRERFARCLVLRQRNQALHRPSELARGNDETWPDGLAGWATDKMYLVVRADSRESCRPARKFPHKLVMRKPSEPLF